MNNGIEMKNLSDLDLSTLQKGFTIVYENDKPVAVIASIEYYTGICELIAKARQYVEQVCKESV